MWVSCLNCLACGPHTRLSELLELLKEEQVARASWAQRALKAEADRNALLQALDLADAFLWDPNETAEGSPCMLIRAALQKARGGAWTASYRALIPA